MSVEKINRQSSDRLRLFVYGTLRKGGVSANYLEGQQLMHQNLSLSGFAMYDAGWYPFVIPAGPESFIMGDVYEVEKSMMPALGSYEGGGYVQHFLKKENLLLYLKADEQTHGFAPVESGDWLSYWRAKGR
jgi:gamma-glutamylcyclotransferase (GGCT)/AIG2-like uncharacterized protein YtfP